MPPVNRASSKTTKGVDKSASDDVITSLLVKRSREIVSSVTAVGKVLLEFVLRPEAVIPNCECPLMIHHALRKTCMMQRELEPPTYFSLNAEGGFYPDSTDSKFGVD